MSALFIKIMIHGPAGVAGFVQEEEFIVNTGRVKTAVIGCGVISNTYLRDLNRLCLDTIELYALSDMDQARAREKAETFSVPRVMTVEEILADPEIELVVDLTPPMAHVDLNRRILNAGKHLFTEKPFAMTLEEAKEIRDLGKAKGLIVGSAPDSFLGSSLTTCRKLLEEGAIGKPLYVSANMMSHGMEDWHIYPEPFYSKGGGPVYDMGGYYFSTLVSMFGSVESVFAVGAKGMEKRVCHTPQRMNDVISVDVDTHYAVILKLKNGMIANMNFSFDIWQTEMPKFEIYGTEGTLYVPDPNMHGATPRLYRGNQKAEGAPDDKPVDIPERIPNVGEYVRYIGVLDVARSIREGRDTVVNADLACHIVDIMTGIFKSAESGAPVFLTTEYDALKIEG